MIKLQSWNSLNLKYCGIIVREGPLLVAFVTLTHEFKSPRSFSLLIADLLPKKLLPTSQENFG